MQFTNKDYENSFINGSLIKDFPKCNSYQPVKDAMDGMDSAGLGFCIVIGKSIGIFTDGDLRRNISKGNIPLYAFLSKELEAVSSIPCKFLKFPFTTDEVIKLAKSGISYAPVLDKRNNCIFVIDIKVFTLTNA